MVVILVHNEGWRERMEREWREGGREREGERGREGRDGRDGRSSEIEVSHLNIHILHFSVLRLIFASFVWSMW